MDISFASALVGGILTLLSPCSVMLLPAFFSYAFADDRKIIAQTVIFYLGLIFTLVPMGVLAGSVGSFIGSNRELLINIAASAVIVFGIIQLFGIPLPTFSFLQPNKPIIGINDTKVGDQRNSRLSVFILGTVYGLAGACTGPILGSVLSIAAISGNALYGGLILAVFAFGMVVPLLLFSLLWKKMPKMRNWLRPRELSIGRWQNSWTQIISGVLSIGIGIYLIISSGGGEIGLLGAKDQFSIETMALDATRNIPNYLIAGVAFICLLFVWLAPKLLSKKKKSAAKRHSSPQDTYR